MQQNNIKGITNFQMVGNFHDNFGHAKFEQIQQLNLKTAAFRLSLIAEEIAELVQAVSENDMTETIDALADILYVVYGMGHTFGINLDDVFVVLHGVRMSMGSISTYSDQTNFEKVAEYFSKFNYPRPEKLQKLDTEMQRIATYCVSSIEDCFVELQKAVEEDNMGGVTDALANIAYEVYSMGQRLGIDLDRAFKIVHESNMSKLCISEEQAKETIEHYKTLAGFEDTKVGYRLAPDGHNWVIFNEGNGKILKSKYYELANFVDMIAEAQ